MTTFDHIVITVVAVFIFGMIRNIRVYNFRVNLVRADYDTYQLVNAHASYDRMMCQFWRPLTVKEWLKEKGE